LMRIKARRKAGELRVRAEAAERERDEALSRQVYSHGHRRPGSACGVCQAQNHRDDEIRLCKDEYIVRTAWPSADDYRRERDDARRELAAEREALRVSQASLVERPKCDTGYCTNEAVEIVLYDGDNWATKCTEHSALVAELASERARIARIPDEHAVEEFVDGDRSARSWRRVRLFGFALEEGVSVSAVREKVRAALTPPKES
jgi:hypothetical protein